MTKAVSNRVLLRDFILFQMKLAIDGLKGLAMWQLAIVAFAWDLLFGGENKGRMFYKVLSLAERFDLWLNLYGASTRAHGSGDGLFGASRAGSNTMLGKLEQMVRDFGFEDPLGRDQSTETRRRYAA
jgi:hypothetical protein